MQWADWSPDGSNLAVVRDVGGRNRLEYPIGKVLYETGGWISHPRISPKGDKVAFLDHPLQGDDSGSVAVVDLSGNKKKISGDWYSCQGLAWSADGSEVWFTATETGLDRDLSAVDMAGQKRLVARMPGTLMLFDIFHDGRILLGRASWRRELMGTVADGSKDRDLSWLDYSYPADLSNDGKTVLFDEEGVGGGARYGKTQELTYSVYVRSTDGSAAVRLGEGSAEALSPDLKWVIAQIPGSPAQFRLLPTKAGEAQPLTNDAINHNGARWMPDGKKFVFSGNEPGRGGRLYVQDVGGGQPLAIAPEGVNGTAFAVSPDGQTVAAIGPDLKGYLYPTSGKGRTSADSGTRVGRSADQLESGRPCSFRLPDRRSSRQSLPRGSGGWKKDPLEAARSRRSGRRCHDRSHPRDSRWKIVRLRLPPNSGGPVSGGRTELTIAQGRWLLAPGSWLLARSLKPSTHCHSERRPSRACAVRASGGIRVCARPGDGKNPGPSTIFLRSAQRKIARDDSSNT